MDRFIITDLSDNSRTIRLYYSSIDEAKQHYPNSKIVLDTDKSFLKSVNKIKTFATEKLCDSKGSEVWKIPHNNAFVLYKQFVDDKGNYIDGCMYQRHDNIGFTNPFMWDLTSPKEFEKIFLKVKPVYNKNSSSLVSLKELKKRKAKKFYNKNNKCYWIDENGMFYTAWKTSLPNKASKEEYARFRDNPEAILVSYGTEVACRKTKWFKNMDEFLNFFNKEKEQNPVYLAELKYEIKRKGYKKLPPDDRKVIIALPYININDEIKLARRSTANINGVVRDVANVWCKQMDDDKVFSIPELNIDWVEDVIKKYMEIVLQR